MVPHVARSGRSFKGAGLYYLHDKQAFTTERIAFTHTENTPTQDAEKALKWMAWTALHQAELKRAAGVKATGRKMTKPVYAYSLAWHPDERPDQKQQIEAARDSLKVLGLERHEVVFVAHNDEPHAHVHVIVNRVDPETGKAASLSNDRLKLSTWAERYERDHGKIWCPARVENNRQRAQGAYVRDRDSARRADYADIKQRGGEQAAARAEASQSQARAAHAKEQQRQATYRKLKEDRYRREAERADMKAEDAKERAALLRAQARAVREAKERIREQFRPQWRELFKRQDLERREFTCAEQARIGRLKNILRYKDLALDLFGGHRGRLSAVFIMAAAQKARCEAQDARQKGERRFLGVYQRQTEKDVVRGLERTHDAQRKELAGQQHDMHRLIRERHREEELAEARTRADLQRERRQDRTDDILKDRAEAERDILHRRQQQPEAERPAANQNDGERNADALKREWSRAQERANDNQREQDRQDHVRDRGRERTRDGPD